MNILFYVEPWVEKNWPEWRDLWLSMVHAPLGRALAQMPEIRCFFVTGAAQREMLQRQFGGWLRYDGACIAPEELAPLFPDALAAMLAWNAGMAGAVRTEAMVALLKSKLGDFVPDVVINYFTPAPFLAEAFPRALVLHEDYACFSRPPFPAAFSFDPCGLMRHGFLTRFGGALCRQPLPPQGRKFLAALRRHYGVNIVAARNPFTRTQLDGGRNFRHLVMLPLQVGGSFSFEGQGDFTSQLDMLRFVLEILPPEIGVVVTEHSDWERSLTPEILAALRARYPHFLHHAVFDDYLYPAQFLLPLVDGVVTLSSSVGLQALFWQKPVCALGQSHVNAVADCDDLATFPALLTRGRQKNMTEEKEALLYFLLTRFIAPATPDYLQNPVWLRRYFTTLLNNFRQGVDAGFFPPVDTAPRLLRHYLRHADRDVPKRASKAM